MAQARADESKANDETTATDPFAVSEFTRWARLAEQLAQAEVQRRIAEDLAPGCPVYYAGTGSEAGKLFQHLPDGRRFEVRIAEDGSIRPVREVP